MPGPEPARRPWPPRLAPFARPRLLSGLRLKLTLWVAAVLVVCGAIGFVVVYRSTGSRLRTQVEREITREQAQLSRALTAGHAASIAELTRVARGYVSSLPYGPRSVLLLVLVPGLSTISNHPELFDHGPPEPGELPAEQVQENLQALALEQPRPGMSTVEVPDAGPVRVLERELIAGGVRVIAGAGEPLSLVSEAQHGVARAMLLAGAVLLLLALAASYVAGSLVSAPLRRMATLASRVDAGELAPRMESTGAQGHEVRVLAETFNHMLDRLQAAFAAQREFIADASHELRTPLTVMQGQLEVLAAQEHPDPSEVRRVQNILREQLTRITRLVDDLLLLAQAGRTDFIRPEPIELREFVSLLWEGLSATAPRRFVIGSVPDGSLRADPDRLAQALSNLVRNAIEHTAAQGLVVLEAESLSGGEVRFRVIDDGPGIPPSERERVFERFHRTDPARARSQGGAGLGLAIVRAIAEAHGGSARVTSPEKGNGTCAELLLPRFTPTDGIAEAAEPAARLGSR